MGRNGLKWTRKEPKWTGLPGLLLRGSLKPWQPMKPNRIGVLLRDCACAGHAEARLPIQLLVPEFTELVLQAEVTHSLQVPKEAWSTHAKR